MTVNDGSRPRSRLRLLALLTALPLVAATVAGVLHVTPASAATRAQVLHLMDVNGASVVDRNDHSGHHESDGHHGNDNHHDGDGRDHRGATCNNCGWGNGDHRWDGHDGDHHGGHGHDHDHDGDDDHDRHGLAGFLVEGAKALAHLLGG